MSTEPKYPRRMTRCTPDVPGGLETVYAAPGFFLVPRKHATPDDIVSAATPWAALRRLPDGQLNDDDDDATPAPAQRSGKWAWSTDEENYQGECDSAEAAFIEGAAESDIEDDQTLYVGQIDEPDPVPGITVDRVLEWVEEYLYEEATGSIDEILPRPSAVQKAALEEALRSAYRGWLAANPDQKPQWFRIKGKVLEKTGAEIRELYKPDA